MSELAGLVHADMVGDKLTVVLVGGEHQHLKSFDFSVFGQRTDQVIRLIAVDADHCDLEGVEDAFDVGNGCYDVVGRGLAVLLVVFVLDVSEGGCAGVERHRHVGRFLVLEHLVQRVGEAEHRGGVQPLGGESRTLDHRVVRSENQAHSIYQEDFFRHCLSLFLGKAKVQKNETWDVRRETLGSVCRDVPWRVSNGASFFTAINKPVRPNTIFWHVMSYSVLITPIGTFHGGFTMSKICSQWISLNAVCQGRINDVKGYA